MLSRSSLYATFTALVLSGCTLARTAPVAPLPVDRVDSAHSGHCPPNTYRTFGVRAARLFSARLPYDLFHCGSHTEDEVLHRDCGAKDPGNVVFLHFSKPVHAVVGDERTASIITVRSIGEAWEANAHRAILYLPARAFFLERWQRQSRLRGAERYSLFGVDGDPLGIAATECPVT